MKQPIIENTIPLQEHVIVFKDIMIMELLIVPNVTILVKFALGQLHPSVLHVLIQVSLLEYKIQMDYVFVRTVILIYKTMKYVNLVIVLVTLATVLQPLIVILVIHP